MRTTELPHPANNGSSSLNNMQTDSTKCKVPPHDKDRFGCIKCPNMEQVGSDWDAEHYECKMCGESFELHYEEMK